MLLSTTMAILKITMHQTPIPIELTGSDFRTIRMIHNSGLLALLLFGHGPSDRPSIFLRVYLGSERTRSRLAIRTGFQSPCQWKTYSSYCNAMRYITKTSAEIRTPAVRPLYKAVPRKDNVLPQYIGAPVTLKGNPSTFLSMRIPK